MDKSENGPDNPIRGVVSEGKRVTRSVSRALKRQIVGSIVTQIDTGIERPISFATTDYLSLCSGLNFPIPAQLGNSVVRVTDEVTFGSRENSLTFFQKLERLTINMSEEQEDFEGFSLNAAQGTSNAPESNSNAVEYNRLMSMMVQQNLMMSKCLSEIAKMSGEIASLSHRVADVECSRNTSVPADPRSTSTPDRNRPNPQDQEEIAESEFRCAEDTARQQANLGSDGDDRHRGNRRTVGTGVNDITYDRSGRELHKIVDIDRWHIKFDGSGKEMTFEFYFSR